MLKLGVFLVSRKLAREMAVCFLFQVEFQKENIKEQVESFIDSYGETNYDKDYFLEIINGVLNSLKEIDELIEANTKDLPILRVAVYEIKHREDIPVGVSINEAVELAKKYGSDDSARFINGLLGQID